MGFVDTNVFIEEVCRKGAKSDKCHELLCNKTLWTTGLVLSEVEWVMRSIYEKEKELLVLVSAVATVLKDGLALLGIDVLEEM